LCRKSFGVKEKTEHGLKGFVTNGCNHFFESYSNNVAEIMDAEDPLLYFTLQDQPETKRNVAYNGLYGANCILLKCF
jgi:hypothetical protein